MIRATASLLCAAAALALAGCAEQDQTVTGIKSDTAFHQGTSKPYVAVGWKPGDRNSWEQHLKVRTINGQNDHVRVP